MSVGTPTAWPAGPASGDVAELIRTLELTVNRKLDGMLHGQHQGLTPGHGSEPGEARGYQPGDDVRRIDWAVTARTNDLHVRDLIADRDLQAWMVVDASAAMRFGTAKAEKAQIALAAAAAIGFLTARNQNRLGAVLAAGPYVRLIPPRPGRDQVRAVLQGIAGAPDVEGQGHTDLAGAIGRVAALARQRGFVAVISDFSGAGWQRPLGALAGRHEVLAVQVNDQREHDLPPVGWVTLADPATGAQREVRVTPEVQRRFAAAAAARHEDIRRSLVATGADHLVLRTDDQWLATIVNHLRRRRMQAVRGQAKAGVIR
jgi:uncharacterized protein (DUF58 family)